MLYLKGVYLNEITQTLDKIELFGDSNSELMIIIRRIYDLNQMNFNTLKIISQENLPQIPTKLLVSDFMLVISTQGNKLFRI